MDPKDVQKFFVVDKYEVCLSEEAPASLRELIDDLSQEVGIANKSEIVSVFQDAISDIVKRLPDKMSFDESSLNIMSVTMNVSERSVKIAKKIFEEQTYPTALMREVEEVFGKKDMNMVREVITVFEGIVSERIFEQAKRFVERELESSEQRPEKTRESLKKGRS